VIDLFVVPFDLWWDGIRGFVTPAMPPDGISATQLGGLAGFTALASGLNWYVMGHYRDKGYGMGHRAGYISGLRGARTEILASGVTFADTPDNRRRWKRWYRLLLADMWGIFFVGAMLGMLLPTILMAQAVQLSGDKPTTANVPTFVAAALGDEYGRGMFYLALVIGVLVLFSTQLVVFESLVRIVTDAGNGTSGRFQRMTGGDPRKFYYPFMAVLFLVIAFLIFQALPLELIRISANMSNLAALIIPFGLIYLNRRLPRPARIRWWGYVALLANVLFFGFFFVNFVFDFLGDPLVVF